MDYIKVVTQYKTSKDKESFVKKHIKRSYVPYTEKLTEAIEIAKQSTHIVIDEKEIYKKNTPMTRFLSMIRIITLYTDIECEQDQVINMYDALSKEGLMVQILSSIPETEIGEFMSLVDMCIADTYENEREISTIVENKMEAINIVLSQVFSVLENTLSQPEVKEALEDKIKQFAVKDNTNNNE